MNLRLPHTLFVTAAAMCAVLPAAAQTPAANPVTHNSQCGLTTQSLDDHGRTVVVAQCSGDLPGVLTLVIADPNAATLGSEWALNVSYTAPLHPDAPMDPNATDPDEAVGEQLIQKGTIYGTIAGGTASSVNGQVTLLNGVQLGLTAGSMQFTGIVKGAGSGAASATNLDDRSASSTTLTLTF